MRISDWSSDVCSSDLPEGGPAQEADRPLTALALGRLRLRLIDGRLQRPRAAPHQRQPDEADEQREGKAARAPDEGFSHAVGDRKGKRAVVPGEPRDEGALSAHLSADAADHTPTTTFAE